MEISYLHHRDIDMEKWDKCVKASPNYSVCANPWYLDQFSLSWFAFVADDYKAVMPFFVDDGRVYMPKGLPWIGIYCKDFLQPQVCEFFLLELQKRYKSIDVVFDKFFQKPVMQENLSGLFERKTFYQIDTVGKRYNVEGGIFWSCTKRDEDLEKVLSSNFQLLDNRMSVKESQHLMIMARSSVRLGLGRYMECHDKNGNALAALLVHGDNDWYAVITSLLVPGKFRDSSIAASLIATIITKFWSWYPCVMIVDNDIAGVSDNDLKRLGAKPYYSCRYTTSKKAKVKRFVRSALGKLKIVNTNY